MRLLPLGILRLKVLAPPRSGCIRAFQAWEPISATVSPTDRAANTLFIEGPPTSTAARLLSRLKDSHLRSPLPTDVCHEPGGRAIRYRASGIIGRHFSHFYPRWISRAGAGDGSRCAGRVAASKTRVGVFGRMVRCSGQRRDHRTPEPRHDGGFGQGHPDYRTTRGDDAPSVRQRVAEAMRHRAKSGSSR